MLSPTWYVVRVRSPTKRTRRSSYSKYSSPSVAIGISPSTYGFVTEMKSPKRTTSLMTASNLSPTCERM